MSVRDRVEVASPAGSPGMGAGAAKGGFVGSSSSAYRNYRITYRLKYVIRYISTTWRKMKKSSWSCGFRSPGLSQKSVRGTPSRSLSLLQPCRTASSSSALAAALPAEIRLTRLRPNQQSTLRGSEIVRVWTGSRPDPCGCDARREGIE